MPQHLVVARGFSSESRFICPDARLAEAMAFLRAEPEMPNANLTPLDVNMSVAGDAIYELDGVVGSASVMVRQAQALLRKRTVVETEGACVLHGGSLTVDGVRILVFGPKAAGKTTFMLKALEGGLTVEGDEHVMISSAGVMARPRTLRVKTGSLDKAQALRESIIDSPAIEDWNGDIIYSFAPQTSAVRWVIGQGPVGAIVMLEPNHGGLTMASRLTTDEAFKALLDNSFFPENGVLAAVAQLRVLVGKACLWKLRVGDLERAVWNLRAMAASA